MTTLTEEKLFWNSNKVVENFADRPCDPRILEKLKTLLGKERLKALDLGCGGGRHTEALVELGFDTYACDVNEAMLRHTRNRLSAYLKPGEAKSKIILATASNLPFDDETFDLIVCTGVLHQAKNVQEYEQEISEVARVLRKGGEVLLNIFTNKIMDPTYKMIDSEKYSVKTKEGLFMTLLSKRKFYSLMKKYGLILEDFYSEDIKREFTGVRVILRANFSKQ